MQTTADEIQANDLLANGDVFENLMSGDKVLWNGKKQPLTVEVGYLEAKADMGEEPRTLFVEGPRGGVKMLTQSQKDRDSIRVAAFGTANLDGEWIRNLRIVN